MRPFGPPSSAIQSRDYSSCVRGKPLDDATIEKYIRAGRYGEEKRQALLDREAAQRKKPRKNSFRYIQRILDEILS